MAAVKLGKAKSKLVGFFVCRMMGRFMETNASPNHIDQSLLVNK